MTLAENWVAGIEFNELPAPNRLMKAMERKYAERLRDCGEIMLRTIEYFRKWENEVLGDPNEGHGLFIHDAHQMQIGSHKEDFVFAWCTSLPSITPERIRLIAKEVGYDCMLTIRDPMTLFQRMRQSLLSTHPKYLMQCGYVIYERGVAVEKDILLSKTRKFQSNIFQKDKEKYADDFEYRIAVTNGTFTSSGCSELLLTVGDCTDIAFIEELPTGDI